MAHTAVGKKHRGVRCFCKVLIISIFVIILARYGFRFRGTECDFPGDGTTKRGMEEERGGKIRFYRPVFHPIAIMSFWE